MNINKIILYIMLGLCFGCHEAIAYVQVDPSTLIKVTPKTHKRCVEYYLYQNEIYCSTYPQQTGSDRIRREDKS